MKEWFEEHGRTVIIATLSAAVAAVTVLALFTDVFSGLFNTNGNEADCTVVLTQTEGNGKFKAEIASERDDYGWTVQYAIKKDEWSGFSYLTSFPGEEKEYTYDFSIAIENGNELKLRVCNEYDNCAESNSVVYSGETVTAVTDSDNEGDGSCEIRFETNGGECDEAGKTVKVGEEIGTLPTPVRSGYEFTGWFTSLDGNKKVDSTYVAKDSSIVLYARWKAEELKCENGNVTLVYGKSGKFEISNITGGSGSYTVTETGEKDSKNADTKYFSNSGTTVSASRETPVDKYVLSYRITDEKTGKTTTAVYYVTISKTESDVTAPTGKTLVYTGYSQQLINEGKTNSGVLQYRLENGSYSSKIPTAINAGTYKVYYKVSGDSGHNDTEEKYVTSVIEKAENKIVLSSSSGSVSPAKTLITFKVSSNPSGAALTLSNSNPSAVSASISGLTVTVGMISEGSSKITLSTSETSNYKSGSAVYEVTASTGSADITVTNGSAVYNGNSTNGGAKVTVSGPKNYEIKYGEKQGTYNLSDIPSYTDAGKYTVYYRVTASSYSDKTGSFTIEIKKASGQITAPKANTLIYTGENQKLAEAGESSTGTVMYRLENGSYSTAVPTASKAGTYTIYYYSKGDANHSDTEEKSIKAVIRNSSVQIPSEGSPQSYTGNVITHNITVPDGASIVGDSSTTSATNTGTYSVYFKLNGNNLEWSDGTSGMKKTQWSIVRAPGLLTLSNTDMTIKKGESAVSSVTASGLISVVSSDSSVATASVSGSTVTVKGISAGTAVITVTSEKTINYEKTTREISVTVSGSENGISDVDLIQSGAKTFKVTVRSGSADDIISVQYRTGNQDEDWEEWTSAGNANTGNTSHILEFSADIEDGQNIQARAAMNSSGYTESNIVCYSAS